MKKWCCLCLTPLLVPEFVVDFPPPGIFKVKCYTSTLQCYNQSASNPCSDDGLALGRFLYPSSHCSCNPAWKLRGPLFTRNCLLAHITISNMRKEQTNSADLQFDCMEYLMNLSYSNRELWANDSFIAQQHKISVVHFCPIHYPICQ